MTSYKPQPWEQGLIGPDRKLADTAEVHVYSDRAARAANLPDFVSRMSAEWVDIDGRLAIVKPNVTVGIPTQRHERRVVECEAIAWDIIRELKLRHFNEAYLVDWTDGQGLKILSPVVAGMYNADDLDEREQRELILRNPEAAAEFVAEKVITNDFDDVPRNYIIADQGGLVRIDYGFAFTAQMTAPSDLGKLMGCVPFNELAIIPSFRRRYQDIIDRVDSVPRSRWQHIVAPAQWIEENEKAEIVDQLREAGGRMRKLLGPIPPVRPGLPGRQAELQEFTQ